MCLSVPARIEKIDKDTALVDFGGVKRKISLGIMTDVKKGDNVLVHAGFAIGKIGKKDAEDTRRALDELRAAINEEIKKNENR